MAGGINDKRSSTTNNRGDHHHIVNISTSTSTPSASSPQPCPVTSTSANPVVQFSGTVESFNNYESGSQDFSDATISSSRTGASFNNLRSGTQTFRAAEIRCADDKRSASVLPWKRDHVPGGILHSFNNANGSQKFDGANINFGGGHKALSSLQTNMAKKAKGSNSASSASASASSGKLVLRIKSNKGIKRSVRQTNARKKPKAKQKKNKQKFDAMKPKKPPTAFFYFLEDFRKEFQVQNPDVKSMRDIGKACGEKWKTMTYEEKVQYYDTATEKRKEFDRAMAEFNKKMESGEFDETDEESEFDE